MKTIERYRPSMNEEVLHSWARDAQEIIDHRDKLYFLLQELAPSLSINYSLSPEGRSYITKIKTALNNS